MRYLFLLITLFIASLSFAQSSFYDLSARTIDGKNFKFNQLKGKKVLIVNTASKCGLTPQYIELEELYKEYGDESFTILGFPSNNFLKQEPGSNKEIKEFCRENYGVTFQMMEKISVKGKDMHPVYQWLTEESENGVKDSNVKWNFQKYLIDENGKLVEVISPKTSPLDETIVNFAKQ